MKVCILSSHPFFLREFLKLIPAGKLNQERELDRQNVSDMTALTLPKAAVYVIDGQHSNAVLGMIALIREHRPKAHLLVVSDDFNEQTAFPLLQAGVKGLLTYSTARQQLPCAIETVAEGRYWMPRALLSSFIHSMLDATPKAPRSEGLLKSASRREKQILEHVLDNRSNKEIASQLNISERTVKFHVSNLLAKSGVQRRTDLILLALQTQNSSLRVVQ